MLLKQYYLGSLAHASYLVADEGSGLAAVIDPQRDVEQYLDDADRRACRIRHVFLTHFHADFVAGHLELHERCGAEIHLGARATAEYPFTPMGDGDAVRLGDVRLEVIETPGHSPESISILVYDDDGGGGGEPPEPGGARARAPHAVLTGDTLLIGDVGRPDLRASLGWRADELARMLYESVHTKLIGLPDGTLVYPAHGAGSLCARHLSGETVSTIGAQRRCNGSIQPMSRERFVELMIADQPEAPPYFTYDAVLNTRERPTLERVLERRLVPLSAERALALSHDGAQLLDARDPSRFADGHVAGSVSVGLEGSFETWCGTVLDPRRPVVLVTEPGREREALTRLGRIGFDDVAGYVEGGVSRFDAGVVRRIERITAGALAERLRGPAAPELIDVRAPSEFADGAIEGAINLPLGELAARVNTELAARLATVAGDRDLVVYCEAGYRSVIAASLMLRAGIANVASLVGGLAAWRRGPGRSSEPTRRDRRGESR